MTRRGTLLVVEFTGIDDDRRFDELIPAARQGEVRKVDPLPAHFRRDVTIADQATEIAGGAEGPVDFVLAVCSAATIAVHLVARLAADQDAPHVVLIDPFRVTDALVRSEFATLFANLGGDAGPVLAAAVADRDEALLRRLEDALFTRRDALVEACGGDAAADVALYLLHRYRAWLRLLSACARAGPAPSVVPVSVLSATGAADLEGIVVEPHRTRVYRCDTGAAGDTSDHVHRILGVTPTGATLRKWPA